MNFLTNFADQAVLLPLAACVFGTLLALRWRRGALAWGACVAGVLAVMLVLKLVALACGAHFAWTGVVSPSGHTATAAVVYGGLFALLAPPSRTGTLVAAAAGGLVALGVGLTRLALHVHTPADVLVGAAVGVAGAVLMRRLAGAAAGAAGVPLASGWHVPGAAGLPRQQAASRNAPALAGPGCLAAERVPRLLTVGSKAFFFEKKKQKAFVCAAAACGDARSHDVDPTGTNPFQRRRTGKPDGALYRGSETLSA